MAAEAAPRGGSEVAEVLDFGHARDAAGAHARVTPLLPHPELSQSLDREILVKAECLQHTGSFKVRGAAASLEALGDEERARGVVACSSGNHGRAVSWVASRLGIPATIYVPSWVDPVKLAGIEAAGAEAVRAGETFDESEALALERAEAEGSTYVSAYDDPEVIAGQGTLTFEILEQLGDASPAGVIVPLSGGGLVGGMAAALRSDGRTDTRIVAASAERAAVMLTSVRRGRPVELPEEETLASALAGGIGLDNRYSFPLVRDLVEHHVTVDEDEIAHAMRHAVERLRLVVEGGGAVGLAALLARSTALDTLAPGPVVVLLSGGNVAAAALADVLRRR